MPVRGIEDEEIAVLAGIGDGVGAAVGQAADIAAPLGERGRLHLYPEQPPTPVGN